MPEVNINDRRSIEQAYSRHDHDEDVGANSQPKATVHRGVRIAAGPDGSGTFPLVRASRHVGEVEATGEALFLAPVRSFDAALKSAQSGYGEVEAAGLAAEPARAEDAYDAFIDRIVAAVRSARFETPLESDDERIKGFRGG